MIPGNRRLTVAALSLTAALACGESPAAPAAGEPLPRAPDPALAVILDDPWAASFLNLEDVRLRTELGARTHDLAAFRSLVGDRLFEPARMSPDDAISLTVLDLTLRAATTDPRTIERNP